MKKVLAVLLTALLLGLSMATPVMATETTREVVATYEDGSYAVVENTEVIVSNARASTVSKSGSRTFTLYNGDDVAQWDYTLYGTFLYRYTISAQAQNRSDDYNIYNTAWTLGSHSTSIDYDTVYGVVNMKKMALFVTTVSITQNLSISCDCYGKLTYGNLADPG